MTINITKGYFHIILLVMFSTVIISETLPYNELRIAKADDKVKVNKKELKSYAGKYLSLLLEDSLTIHYFKGFNFRSKQEMKMVVLGEPFQVYTMRADTLNKINKIKKNINVCYKTNYWIFPVISKIDGRIIKGVGVTVYNKDKYFGEFGGTGAKDICAIDKAFPDSLGYKKCPVRVDDWNIYVEIKKNREEFVVPTPVMWREFDRFENKIPADDVILRRGWKTTNKKAFYGTYKRKNEIIDSLNREQTKEIEQRYGK